MMVSCLNESAYNLYTVCEHVARRFGQPAQRRPLDRGAVQFAPGCPQPSWIGQGPMGDREAGLLAGDG